MLLDGGCVFLPAAGYYVGSSWSYGGSHGNYWSSALRSGSSDRALNLDFYDATVNTPSNNKSASCLVRLVRE